MLLIKYRLYCLVAHYHCEQMNACIAKQNKFFNDTKKFRKYGMKFCKHASRFDELQIPIDKLKEEISAKYGDQKNKKRGSVSTTGPFSFLQNRISPLKVYLKRYIEYGDMGYKLRAAWVDGSFSYANFHSILTCSLSIIIWSINSSMVNRMSSSLPFSKTSPKDCARRKASFVLAVESFSKLASWFLRA